MRPVRWLLAPADEAVPRGHAAASAALRVLVGLLWLYNVSWKRPPDFGQASGNGLYGFTNDAVEHPVLPPFSWVVEQVVLPNFTIFGWAVLVVETALAVLLLTGAYVRLAAAVGIVQSLAIGLSVAMTPGEWPWAYWMMIGIHVVLLFSAAGRYLAVDALRSRRSGRATSSGVPDGRRLALVWGVVISVAALVALLTSVGDDVFAPSGASLGGPGLSIGLGAYNLAGAAVLLVCGLALLGAGSTGSEALAAVAGVVAGVVGLAAAVLLYVQIGFSDPLLGGTNTSAAVFLSVAVVGGAVRTTDRRATTTSRPEPQQERV